MKHLITLLCLVSLLSCQKKVVELPEIQSSNITEVLDVSPIYLFYDEEADAVEFNRKNMIGTTNWLVNIDKRLTLQQVLPHLQYLQEKRRGDGMHKNENARNYFTCNDTSIKNLGFIEFTDIEYHLQSPSEYYEDDSLLKPNTIFIGTHSLEEIEIMPMFGEVEITKSNQHHLIKNVDSFSKKTSGKKEIILFFSQNLSFQDYITIKSLITQLDPSEISISNYEFIY